jgi:hypothetical protein
MQQQRLQGLKSVDAPKVNQDGSACCFFASLQELAELPVFSGSTMMQTPHWF